MVDQGADPGWIWVVGMVCVRTTVECTGSFLCTVSHSIILSRLTLVSRRFMPIIKYRPWVFDKKNCVIPVLVYVFFS